MTTNARRLVAESGLVVVLLLLLAAPTLAQRDGLLTHDPVTSATAGEPVLLRAELEGMAGDVSISDARVYFRTPGFSAWDSRLLEADFSSLSGRIPGRAVSSEGVEYFLEVTLSSGEIYSFPALEPRDAPLMINVRSGGVEAEVESGIFVISPEPGGTYEEPSLLITASFNPGIYKVDPKKVILRLDGRTITGKATVNEYLINAIVQNVDDGRHRVDLLEKKDKREVLLRTWHFTYRSPFDESGKATYRIAGSVGVDGRSQQFNGYQQSILRETVNLRFEQGGFRSQLYARMTSEEHASLQPQHRLRLTAGWEWLQLGLGDLTPRYSELILYGQRIRGAELRLKYGILTLQGIYGQLKRPIDGTGYTEAGVDSFLVTPGTNPIYESYNTYNYDPGTFQRNTSALRLQLGKQSGIRWGLTFLKARDDLESVENNKPGDLGVGIDTGINAPTEVNYLRTPKDNMVVGSDLKMNFDRRRVTFTAEAAVSLYNGNIAVRALDEAEAYSNIIVVNQYFEPLPESFGGDGEDELSQSDLISALLNNSLSWQTKLRLRYFGHDVRTGYKFINRSYLTLGNPTLPNDDAGFFLYDRVRLLDSRLYLNGGYRIFHNNVRGRSERSLWRNEVSFGVGYYTPPGWPDFNVSVRQQGNKNNGEVEEIIVDEGEGTSYLLDDRLSNATGSVIFGVNQTVDWIDTRNTVSLTYTQTARADEYQEFGDSNMGMVAVAVQSDLTNYLPMSSRVTFSSTQQAAMEDRTELTYTMLSARLNFFFLDRKFVPYLNPKLTLGDGDYALAYTDEPPTGADPAATPLAQTIDFTRIDWAAGFEWRFMRNHIVTGRASFTEYQDKGGIVYFDGSVGSNTSTIDRNDYAMVFGYTYKF